jgi:hypothetical protein
LVPGASAAAALAAFAPLLSAADAAALRDWSKPLRQ